MTGIKLLELIRNDIDTLHLLQIEVDYQFTQMTGLSHDGDKSDVHSATRDTRGAQEKYYPGYDNAMKDLTDYQKIADARRAEGMAILRKVANKDYWTILHEYYFEGKDLKEIANDKGYDYHYLWKKKKKAEAEFEWL